jgi:hypothetical protein
MQLDSETGKLEALRVDGTLGNAGLFDSLWTRPSNLAVSSTEPSVLALATPSMARLPSVRTTRASPSWTRQRTASRC